MATRAMNQPKVVSPAEWLAARKELLKKEKEFTQLRDQLSQQRRDLPWEKVEKSYVFDGPKGKETLADLFGGRSQLIVYHFMFGPDWKEGCPSCSFISDHIDGSVTHLAARDVRLAVVSRAPLAQIEAFKKRMSRKEFDELVKKHPALKEPPTNMGMDPNSPMAPPTSITTITCQCPRRRSEKARSITTMECKSFQARNGPERASSTRMPPAISSTLIRATVAGWTYSSGPTTGWTLRQRAATKRA